MRLFKGLFSKVDQLLTGRRPVDDKLFDELEELLIQADLSLQTTTKLVDALRDAARKERLRESDDIKERLKVLLVEILAAGDGTGLRPVQHTPTVYMFVGVNGVGKTTTIAKLAYRFKKQGRRVLLAAADTFRAAAIEQLDIWANRVGVEIIKHQNGADPGAVVFDTIQAAIARKADVVIVDTAGRLHTKTNLMEELKKVGRIVEKALGRQPDETLLVLDATTGQNAVVQAREFMNAVPVSGIALAKIDGTAKGGIIVTIKDELGLPIKLVGSGEKLDDLEDFDPSAFVEALFRNDVGENSVYISVLIPAYNEENRIVSTLDDVEAYLESLGKPYEIIVIDDGSRDRTVDIVMERAVRSDAVRLVSYRDNAGKGYAVRQGVFAARGYVMFSDADMSAPIAELSKLFEAIDRGDDIAIGSRAVKGAEIPKHQPLYRELGGKALNRVIRALAVRGIRDTQCGFKLFRGKAARDIFGRCFINGWGFDVEVLYLARRLHYSIREVGVRWGHVEGSKIRPFRAAIRVMQDLVRMRLHNYNL